MQMISEVMTRDVRFVAPQDTLQRAAQMMDELNVGALPVCDGERLIGMITDRDITVRATSAGLAPERVRVEEAMSGDVRWCFEDQPLDEVMEQMSSVQIRRVPVVSHDEAHRLVGIVALGDLVTKTADEAQRHSAEQVVEKVSSPSEPDLSQSSGSRSSEGSRQSGTKAGDSANSTANLNADSAVRQAGSATTGPPKAGGNAAVVGAHGGTDAAAGAQQAGTAGPSGNTDRADGSGKS